MTRYTVVWPEGAEEDLARIWLSGPDREAVAAAADSIDSQLAENATVKGLELSEGLRALHAPPLRVLFVVRDEDRIVEILRVKRDRRPG
jgi:plasmid stabilization system protein ParE